MFAAGNDRKVYKIRRRTKEKISVDVWQHNPVITVEPMIFTPGEVTSGSTKECHSYQKCVPEKLHNYCFAEHIRQDGTVDRGQSILRVPRFLKKPIIFVATMEKPLFSDIL